MKLDFSPRREKFLILEMVPSGEGVAANAVHIAVDEDRNIIFEKILPGADFKKILGTLTEKITRGTWEGQHLIKPRERLIAVADSKLATTVPIPLELNRADGLSHAKITLAELENTVAQGMARVWRGSRTEAAKRLEIDETDAVLVSVKADRFAVDGKSVITPIGSTGKMISLLLELIFAERRLAEILQQFFAAPEGLFFAEAPQAELAAISRVRRLPVALLKNSSLYVFAEPKNGQPVLYREKINWSFDSIPAAISEVLSSTPMASEKIYCSRHNGGLSAKASRFFDKATEHAIESLSSELSRAKIKGEIFYDMPHPLPDGDSLSAHPVKEIADHFGFTADLEKINEGRRNLARRAVLYFLEAYFDSVGNTPINSRLKRRIHWLAV